MKAVVKPHFTTDQHQDERSPVVADVWERTLEDAGQIARTIALLGVAVSRDIGLIRSDERAVCRNRQAYVVIFLDETGSRRDESLPKAGVDREGDLILIHLRRHHTSVNATLKGDRPIRVPPWCAFAHGLSLNPLDGE